MRRRYRPSTAAAGGRVSGDARTRVLRASEAQQAHPRLAHDSLDSLRFPQARVRSPRALT